MTTIELIEPTNGSVTAPLQRYCWLPHDHEGSKQHFEDAIVVRSLMSLSWIDLGGVDEDKSIPRPICFAWRHDVPDANDVEYELIISRHDDLRDPVVFKNVVENQNGQFVRKSGDVKVAVWHLHIASRYFWQVVATQSEQIVAASPLWSFTTHRSTPRWIQVPGMTNVRDIGGWPLSNGRRVRQGVLYRSSALNNFELGTARLGITDEGKRLLIEDLGIRTDLELRGDVNNAPALDQAKVKWIPIPIRPYDEMLDYTEQYRDIFRIFADPSHYPMICHCAGGADRTGTLSFLLHALLGVGMSDLIRDYELTSFANLPRSHCADYFAKFLQILDTFDSGGSSINDKAERYLRSIGVTDSDLAAIRAQLIVRGD